MTQIDKLIREAHKTAREKGFYDGESKNIPEKLCLIHSEVSETLEVLRESESGIENSDSLNTQNVEDRAMFTEELADVVIRVFDLCGYLNLDLNKAIEDKMSKNKKRDYKHKKRF